MLSDSHDARARGRLAQKGAQTIPATRRSVVSVIFACHIADEKPYDIPPRFGRRKGQAGGGRSVGGIDVEILPPNSYGGMIANDAVP
ncbi:hypothetical protein [Leptolyngbya sp. 7M]|uniref:hypothetical protein n=1 Tax=Leptolyngbya sp. 7M TaxID=2812896 RepID=UPI001B8CE9B4|nr:hypothetical protein [Leptolyngbya sp. 7M]QYO64429.1 hypothetical protein JVX88_32895 [Leptolyngbya sp. 7M]